MKNNNIQISKELLNEFYEKGWLFDKEENGVLYFKAIMNTNCQLIINYDFKEYFAETVSDEGSVALMLEDHILINKLFRYWGWV
ncbi:MAG: hypothetical protein IKT40_03465 [Bacilli bacterium]|nr:hypothetical protein [Bacilli bacterium]